MDRPMVEKAPSSMPDFARIKRNVAKMASMSAPVEDIDGYIASEGVTVEQIRAFKPVPDVGPRAGISTATGRPVEPSQMMPDKASGGALEFAEEAAPIVGMMAGGAAGGVPGAGLGYAAGGRIAQAAGEARGIRPRQGMVEAGMQTAKDVAVGATMEAGGQAAGPILAGGVKGIGKFARSLLGRMTGTGEAAMEEAIKSGKIGPGVFKSATDFDRALRGKIDGEEIVNNARLALNTIKDSRQQQYQSSLAKLASSQKPIDLNPIKSKVNNILSRFVRIDKATGQPDWSRSSLGPEGSEGVNKVKEIVDIVSKWGSKAEDSTPLGLDMLKRQLDDFYSESSNARALVASVRSAVKDETAKAVPEYAKMTQGYEEATKLIKDIESGLSMKKQGLSGRVTADQTLRRLQSAMRDNFPLRRELVQSISNTQTGDIQAQIAGNVSRAVLPHGLAGTGPAIVGEAALAHYVNPAFWPVVAASSPRVAGEFLRLYGKMLVKTEGGTAAAGKALGVALAQNYEDMRNPKNAEGK